MKRNLPELTVEMMDRGFLQPKGYGFAVLSEKFHTKWAVILPE